jgi:hypothetical protein
MTMFRRPRHIGSTRPGWGALDDIPIEEASHARSDKGWKQDLRALVLAGALVGLTLIAAPVTRSSDEAPPPAGSYPQCAGIDNDAARLACYDEVLCASPTSFGEAIASQSPGASSVDSLCAKISRDGVPPESGR